MGQFAKDLKPHASYQMKDQTIGYLINNGRILCHSTVLLEFTSILLSTFIVWIIPHYWHFRPDFIVLFIFEYRQYMNICRNIKLDSFEVYLHKHFVFTKIFKDLYSFGLRLEVYFFSLARI